MKTIEQMNHVEVVDTVAVNSMQSLLKGEPFRNIVREIFNTALYWKSAQPCTAPAKAEPLHTYNVTLPDGDVRKVGVQVANRQASDGKLEHNLLITVTTDPYTPVYAYRRRGLDTFVTCDKSTYAELAQHKHLFETATFWSKV